MRHTTRCAIARAAVHACPRRRRHRYEQQLDDLIVERPMPWRTAANLVRSVVDEWQRELAGTEFGSIKVVAAAYVVFLGVLTGTASFTNALYGFSLPDFGIVPHLLPLAAYLAVFLLVGLLITLPLFLVLRFARSHVSVPVARFAAALGLAMAGEWMLFQMEWFDVWRHGIPGLHYWLTALVPYGLAFAAAGAIIGSALVRGERGDPAMNTRSRLEHRCVCSLSSRSSPSIPAGIIAPDDARFSTTVHRGGERGPWNGVRSRLGRRMPAPRLRSWLS